MNNISLNQTALLDRLQCYFPYIDDIQLHHYCLAYSDFGMMHSDFLSYILNYYNNIHIIFYFYCAEQNIYQIMQQFTITNSNDVQKLNHFYFHDNIKNHHFSYFYIIYDPNYKFIILSDDSLDFSLLLYNINLVKKSFLKTIVDYFILFDEIITHV